MARSASTTAYAATMAELAVFANTAYVPNYATATPTMDGVGAAGAAATVSRGDHRHPVDTSLLSLGGGTMVGMLTLSAVPTVSLHAATKGYVDTATGSSTAAIPGASYADNGGFAVNQRSYVSGTALAASAFGHDRWKAGSGGCTYTFTASPPATTITITAGTLQQVVEGAAIIGGTYTLSWTGTAQGRVGVGSYAASPVTASGIVAGTATTIEFNTGTLGRVKFESGSTATPWVAMSPADDLAKCQRFFEVLTIERDYTPVTGLASIYRTYKYSVTKRASPTITLTNFIYYSGGTNTACTPSSSSGSPDMVAVLGTGLTNGQGFVSGTVTASADL